MPYAENDPGRAPQRGATLKARAPVRQTLHDLLPTEWAPIAKGRREAPLYWCLVDRTALLTAELGEVEVGELLQRARTDEHHWEFFQNVPNLDHGDLIRLGRAWSLLQPYYETLDSIEQPHDHLGRLTQEAWFHEETLELA